MRERLNAVDPVILMVVGLLCAGLGLLVSGRSRALPNVNRRSAPQTPEAAKWDARAKMVDSAAITLAGGLLTVLGLLIVALGGYIMVAM